MITVGRITLARPVARLLRREGVRVETVTAAPEWVDPGHTVGAVHPLGVLRHPVPSGDRAWAQSWKEAGAALARAVSEAGLPWPTGLGVAQSVLRSLPQGSVLFVGSSNSVRDLDLAGDRADAPAVVANRGLAGIDGCVSTAAGVALSSSAPVYALLGDLTFLHDANGLLIGPHEPQPDLTVVVVNDDGGGIFTLLEPGEPERAADFERVFGTPTGTRPRCAVRGPRGAARGRADQRGAGRGRGRAAPTDFGSSRCAATAPATARRTPGCAPSRPRARRRLTSRLEHHGRDRLPVRGERGRQAVTAPARSSSTDPWEAWALMVRSPAYAEPSTCTGSRTSAASSVRSQVATEPGPAQRRRQRPSFQGQTGSTTSMTMSTAAAHPRCSRAAPTSTNRSHAPS